MQLTKQAAPSLSTEEGTTMAGSSEHFASTEFSIRESIEVGSKVIMERSQHPEKHSSPRLSTEDGMQIDTSMKHQANARDSIV
jgi:cephalosporin hydroxylase